MDFGLALKSGDKQGQGGSPPCSDYPKHAVKFVVYGRLYCHLCDDMVAALRAHMTGGDYSIEIIDVDREAALEEQFGEWVPVLFADGQRLCHYHLDALKVDEYLRKIS